MNMKRLIKASMLLMVAALFAACANEDIAQDKKKENETEAPKGGVIFAANEPKISAKRLSIGDEDEFAGAKTRTNIKHTAGQGADAVWINGDFIWVKKQDGTWAQSTSTTLHDGGASAEFTLPGSMADYADGCEVRYTGYGAGSYAIPSGPDWVGFPYQFRNVTTANDFTNAGGWGDCGSGKAYNTGNPAKFNFRLSHKAAYLCFLPRCENIALAPNIRLTCIKLTVTKCYNNPSSHMLDIFTFDGENLTLGGVTGATNTLQIDIPDFPLSTTANQEANAVYTVIRPDKYDFKIEYTIKDPMANIETVVTDIRTGITLDKGKIYDVTADLTVPALPSPPNFYMWDALQHYWWGHESEQPLEEGGFSPSYPQSKATDPQRWYNDTNPGNDKRYDASRNPLFKTLPNANEFAWYVNKGDPHWGNDGKVYAKNGHLLHLRGMWLRKKSAIVTYLKNVEHYPTSLTEESLKDSYRDSPTATPVDYRAHGGASQNYSVIDGNPNTTDYFFLPAWGIFYDLGKYIEAPSYYSNSSGFYWSSSAIGAAAYVLYFDRGHRIFFGTTMRQGGFLARPFE